MLTSYSQCKTCLPDMPLLATGPPQFLGSSSLVLPKEPFHFSKCFSLTLSSFATASYLQPKRIENARILVANTAMDTDKVKIYGARVRTDSMNKVCLRVTEEQSKP